MAPFISGMNDKSPLYSLYAVVVHLDIMDAAFSGHYVCYVKNFSGEWFRIDDSTVSSFFIFNFGTYIIKLGSWLSFIFASSLNLSLRDLNFY